jgi:hypothetical protein
LQNASLRLLGARMTTSLGQHGYDLVADDGETVQSRRQVG